MHPAMKYLDSAAIFIIQAKQRIADPRNSGPDDTVEEVCNAIDDLQKALVEITEERP